LSTTSINYCGWDNEIDKEEINDKKREPDYPFHLSGDNYHGFDTIIYKSGKGNNIRLYIKGKSGGEDN
jgi:hypothetical protein